MNGVKCAIVERNCSQERTDFLKELLEWNKYTVVLAPSAPAKPVAAATTENVEAPAAPLPPTSFTIGVTDVTFNAVNAVFGRLLKTKDGRVVTLAYWQEKEKSAQDEVPYFVLKHNQNNIAQS